MAITVVTGGILIDKLIATGKVTTTEGRKIAQCTGTCLLCYFLPVNFVSLSFIALKIYEFNISSQFKQARWSTNKPSDLHKILRYELLTYKLWFSKDKYILHYEFGYFPEFWYRVRLLKETNTVFIGHDHRDLLKKHSINSN